MPTFLLTRWTEFFAYIKADSLEDAQTKVDSKNVRWSQTMNLKPKDLIIVDMGDINITVENIDSSEVIQKEELSEAEEALNAFLSAQNEYESAKDKYMDSRAHAMSFVGKGISPDYFA